MTQPHSGTPKIPAALAARPRDARRGLPIPPVNIHPNPNPNPNPDPDSDRGGWHVDFTTINTAISARSPPDDAAHCAANR